MKHYQEEGEYNFKVKILHEVVTLKDGVGFGELALINDEPRSATLICAEDTEFITICAEDYKTVI